MKSSLSINVIQGSESILTVLVTGVRRLVLHHELFAVFIEVHHSRIGHLADLELAVDDKKGIPAFQIARQ
jgi:hypothetical protein